MTMHNCQDLIMMFNELFEQTEKTILIGNAEEPLYLPADASSPFNRVIFTRHYFASALHEIAHWCIASEKRRQLVDYGYWYFPEGRSLEQQLMFERAEVKPQALECLFSRAAGSRFIVSKDDFSMRTDNALPCFESMVQEQAQRYIAEGLPEKAEIFINRLREFY